MRTSRNPCILKLIYPYFVLAQQVIINFIQYYQVNRVCLYIKHVKHCFEFNFIAAVMQGEVRIYFGVSLSHEVHTFSSVYNVPEPQLCKWLPRLSKSKFELAVYPNHFIICLITSVPNLMLVSQNAQFL